MPHDAVILGLKDYEIKDMYRADGGLVIEARYSGPVLCPHCNGVRLRKKDRFVRRLRHESWGMRQCHVHLEALKFHCQDCGRYFNQRFPGIRCRYRSTEVFRRQIFWQHYDGICRKRLSERQHIGTATVERWFHDFLEREISERSDEPCPQELGIDEHFFTKQKGYATTFCDLKHHKVYDVVLGRSELSLQAYMGRLRGKDKVRVVCIDLSSSYRSIIRKYFPNAKIVADRFHVMRLVNHHFLAAWREIDPQRSRNRGLLSLMRRHEENLKPEQKERLQAYLAEYPALEAIYAFKQRLCRLLRKKCCTAKRCRRWIRRLISYINQLKTCGIEQLETLGRTLGSWDGEIAAMWRFSKNNGITEGFHNKMETISRMAYGFRNFDNYRLRVRVMCA
ncbi:MAG: ISL3 family transposase [Verrucomicrobia bacterium]|jgi:transposase|nr:ISL3 family transposase [Verrucomicrobiota bacterium]MBT7067664.1 ISL3 family transposase [Verrucomicrobiota bacterium]MBT7701454.1 ISL3 family transposase [Verrucomicrobiota bacterium]